MDLGLDRLRGQNSPKLVERHALMRQGLARQNRVRPFAQHVVLGEGAVGLVFRNGRRGDPSAFKTMTMLATPQ